MAVGEARPGYELWRPNREKGASLTMRFVVILLLLVSVGFMLVITFGGMSLLQGGGTYVGFAFAFAALYILFAVMVARWSRGALTVTAAASMFVTIFLAVGANSWFARDKVGFEEANLPSDLIGLLVVILIPIQIALLIASVIAFNQEWHVEEERPAGGGSTSEPGTPAGGSPQPA